MRRIDRRPARVAWPIRLDPAVPLAGQDRELLAGLHEGFDEAARKAGGWLKCGPGCSDCCHGPFPITRLDVWRLQEGWSDLRLHDPERAQVVRRRALEAAAALRDGFPGSSASGRLTGDQDALDRYLQQHASRSCPVLDPFTGRCELYASRPVACRTYGPPLRFGDEEAPSCPLCFQGADAATIRRSRFEPDPDGMEEAILARMGVAAGREWETLIAFALAPSLDDS